MTPKDKMEGAERIKLKNGGYAFVSQEDYAELSKHQWLSKMSSSGRTSYAVKYKKGDTVRMHNCILTPPKGMEIDHINGDGLDNRRCNLRIATRSQNMVNTVRDKSKNDSRFKCVGVKKRLNKITYYAQISHKGKQHHFGYFDNEVEAALVADIESIKIYGEFARPNFPVLFKLINNAYKEGLEDAAKVAEDRQMLWESHGGCPMGGASSHLTVEGECEVIASAIRQLMKENG